MIRKWYEVSCDMCGTCLNHYAFSPTAKTLRDDDIKVRYKNDKMYTLCEDCFNKINNQ